MKRALDCCICGPGTRRDAALDSLRHNLRHRGFSKPLSMKIGCVCGAVIVDQTDFLSCKAHLVADQDWFDFVESSELHGQIDQSFVRTCYQCMSCGRLYVDDCNRQLVRFVPETANVKRTLRPIKGEMWKAPLIGVWPVEPLAGEVNGSLFCAGAGGTAERYDKREELEQAYFALFYRLQGMGLLRSALLRKGSTDIHVWRASDG